MGPNIAQSEQVRTQTPSDRVDRSPGVEEAEVCVGF